MRIAPGVVFVLATAAGCGGDDKHYALEYQLAVPAGIGYTLGSDLGGRTLVSINLNLTTSAPLTLVRRTDGIWEPVALPASAPYSAIGGLADETHAWSDGSWQVPSPDRVPVAEEVDGATSEDGSASGVAGKFSYIFSTKATSADGHVFWAGRVGSNSLTDHAEVWVHAPGAPDDAWTQLHIRGEVGTASGDLLPRLGYFATALPNGEVWLAAIIANPGDFPQVPGLYQIVETD